MRCDAMELTVQRQFADYYETIKHPMSLEMIHEKLTSGGFHSLFEVCNDFYQMWNNAKRCKLTVPIEE